MWVQKQGELPFSFSSMSTTQDFPYHFRVLITYPFAAQLLLCTFALYISDDILWNYKLYYLHLHLINIHLCDKIPIVARPLPPFLWIHWVFYEKKTLFSKSCIEFASKNTPFYGNPWTVDGIKHTIDLSSWIYSQAWIPIFILSEPPGILCKE